MEKTMTQKGKTMLVKDGFRYRQARLNADGSTSWRCVEPNCRGRLKEFVGNEEMVTEHNHAPNIAKINAVKCVADMRTRAGNGVEKPRQIIQQSTNGLALESTNLLPSYTASQRAIERTRKRKHQPYPTPVTVADIDIPAALRTTSRNTNFVMWDSGADDAGRLLMFGTEDNLGILDQHRHWFVDGTFKVAPELFLQVFTVHALVDKTAIPLIYVLLQDKSERSYTRVFQKLFDLKSTLNPLSVMCDFEKASHNAVARVFPNTQLVGCLFHLGQCLWRKVQEFHLADHYRTNEDIRMRVKMLLALSFVPVDDVLTAFDSLADNSPPEMNTLVEYWEDTYVGPQRRHRRADPRFAISMWNVRERTTLGLPRTNNSVEAWHRAFQQTLDCHHPSVYKLVDQFRKEQDSVEIAMARFNSGFRQPEASKAKYVQLNRRLQAVCETYGATAILDYLRAIAHNLSI